MNWKTVTPAQIEARVYDVVDRVTRGQPIEDALVELKAEWPRDHSKAARRIAGHLNASRGAAVLWIIGLDPKRGVLGASTTETGEWFRSVASNFNGSTPDYFDLNVRVSEQTIVALLISPERVPYVVRNPVYGQENGGPVQWEVPWREGTEVRTARREDLVRLLVPVRAAPSVELLSAELRRITSVGVAPDANNLWLTAHVYFVPADGERIVLPFHRARATVTPIQPLSAPIQMRKIVLREHRRFDQGPETMLSSTRSELIIHGAGTAVLEAGGRYDSEDEVMRMLAQVTLEAVPGDVPVEFRLELRAPAGASSTSRWIPVEASDDYRL